MKKICLYAVISIFMLMSLKKENGFVITAYITGMADSTQVMLTNISSSEVIDSAFVIKNRFSFSGILTDAPEELRIISGPKELAKGNLFYTDLLIGNEVVQLNGDVSDMPLNVTTTGSAVQKKAEQYHKQLYMWNVKIQKLRADLKSFSDTSNTNEKKQVAAKLKAVQDSLENWKTRFIKDNFNSYIALVMYNYSRDFNVDTLRKLYGSLSAELKQSKYGKSINTQINYPKPGPGERYYDFEAITPQGDSFKLSTIKDKYILLQFAGTGCYGSHMSMPEIKYLNQEYKDSVSFVSYFMDNKTDWLNTTRTDNIAWQSLWSKGFKYADACSKYAVTGTPTFFLISPEKKIVATWFGYEKGIVEKEIKMALSKK